MTTRAAIYCRVSTPGQEEDGTSLETQEASCRKYIGERGYEVAEDHVYRDVHSAYELKERPQLTRLRDSIARGAVDVVVAHALDRLSREQNQQGAIIYECDDAGVRLEFVTEDFENSATGKFVRSARAFVAEVEREKIIERTVRGKRARATAGRLIPGPRPLYGYRRNDDSSAYLVDPVTAPIVQRIFTEANLGRSLRAIAQGLTDDGIPTPTGRIPAWWPASVRVILTNPTYTGAAAGWRYTRLKKRGTKGNVILRPAAEHIPLPEGTVPALVDVAVFADVQTTLAGNKLRATRNNHEPERWLLRGGFVRCAHCGYAMHAARPSRGSVAYACPRNSHGRAQCASPRILAETLDTATWERVEAILTDPDLIAAKLAELQANDPTENDAAIVERQIADVRDKHDNIIGNLQLMRMTQESAQRMAERLAALERREHELRQKLDEIRAQRKTWEAAQENLADLQAWCRQVADRLGALSYEQRRLALGYLGVEVRVFDATTYEIEAALPLDQGAIVRRTPSASSRNLLTLKWSSGHKSVSVYPASAGARVASR